MMGEQPTDYCEPAAQPREKPNGKALWLPVALALIAPIGLFLVGWGATAARIDALAQDIEANERAIASSPSTYVPRFEIDAKLGALQMQMEAVQADVEELKKQSERQTAEIIRRIERLDQRRTQ